MQQLQTIIGRWGQRLAALRERAEQNGFVLLLERTVLGFGLHDLSGSAGSIAYFSFFSIFPLLLALVALFGYLIGTQAAREWVLGMLIPLLPVSSDLVIQNVNAAINARGVIGIFSVLLLLWSSTGIFSSITVSVNRAWGVKVGRPFLQQILLDLGMIATIGVLLLLSILATALSQAVSQLGIPLPGPDFLAQSPLLSILAALASLLSTFGGFLAIYKILPSIKVRVRDIWLPALIGTLLFELVKSLFTWYLALFTNYQLVFGSLAAVVVLLFWIYLSALLLLFGAELGAQYTAMKAEAAAPGPSDLTPSGEGLDHGTEMPAETSPARPTTGHRSVGVGLTTFLVALLALVALVITAGRRTR